MSALKTGNDLLCVIIKFLSNFLKKHKEWRRGVLCSGRIFEREQVGVEIFRVNCCQVWHFQCVF